MNNSDRANTGPLTSCYQNAAEQVVHVIMAHEEQANDEQNNNDEQCEHQNGSTCKCADDIVPKRASKYNFVDYIGPNVDMACVICPSKGSISPDLVPEDSVISSSLVADRELDQAVKYLCEATVASTKGLAKRLPRTLVCDIIDGKISPDNVSERLCGLMFEEKRSLYNLPRGTFRLVRGLALHIGRNSFPSRLFNLCKSNDFKSELFYDFCNSLEARILQKNWNMSGTFDCSTSQLLQYSKDATNEFCVQNSRYLDTKLFRNKRGRFLKKCPVYNTTIPKFESYYRESLPASSEDDSRARKDIQRHVKSCLPSLIKRIQQGVHISHLICWECRREYRDLKFCSGCKVAQYCSRDCQRKAWKDGHSGESCKGLASKKSIFLTSFGIIHAAQRNVAIRGILPIALVDYDVAYQVVARPPPWLDTEFATALRGPPMEFYYDNLCRIFNGEFWFYKRADSMFDYMEHFKRLPDWEVKEQHNLFANLAYLLCFDYTGYVGDKGNAKNIEDLFADGPYATELKELTGYPMPALRFVDLYRMGQKCYTERDQHRARQTSQCQGLYTFMQDFHKESQQPPTAKNDFDRSQA